MHVEEPAAWTGMPSPSYRPPAMVPNPVRRAYEQAWWGRGRTPVGGVGLRTSFRRLDT